MLGSEVPLFKGVFEGCGACASGDGSNDVLDQRLHKWCWVLFGQLSVFLEGPAEVVLWGFVVACLEGGPHFDYEFFCERYRR